MKVGAHPLVVAVALGLVGPQVLEEAAPTAPRKACANCEETDALDGLTEAVATQLVSTPDNLTPTTDWTQAPAPSAEDFARVALAFEKARQTV